MEVPEAALSPAYPVKIRPRSAWLIAVGGVIPFAIFVVGVILAGTKANGRESIDAFIFALGLLGYLVVCVRPPGARLYKDHLVVRRFLRSRNVRQQDVRDVLVEHCQRIIGGQSPTSSRDIFLVISERGIDVVVPLMWCYNWLGHFNAEETEAVSETLKDWIAQGIEKRRTAP